MNPNDDIFPLLVRVITGALAELSKFKAAQDPDAQAQVLAPLHAEQQRSLTNATALIQTALRLGVDPDELRARVQEFALVLMRHEMKFASDVLRMVEGAAFDEDKSLAAH